MLVTKVLGPTSYELAYCFKNKLEVHSQRTKPYLSFNGLTFDENIKRYSDMIKDSFTKRKMLTLLLQTINAF